MQIGVSILIILTTGAAGGVVNALINDRGFILPGPLKGENGMVVYQAGWIGNLIVGAAASFTSWGLYGPFSEVVIGGCVDPAKCEADITISAMVGSFLIGIGGARWLTDQVSKNLLRSSAVAAAGKGADKDLAGKIALAPPPTAFLEAAKA